MNNNIYGACRISTRKTVNRKANKKYTGEISKCNNNKRNLYRNKTGRKKRI